MIKTIGGPSSPATAAKAASGPRIREPKITAKFTILPPGRKAHRAKASLNCSAVNQRRRSTMIRRAQAKTPPNPDSEIAAKAVNSSAMVGCGGAAAGGGVAAGGGGGVGGGRGGSGGTGGGTHRSRLTHSGFSGQPARYAPAAGLFSTTICAYIL